jgi:hypothetical protein
LSSKLLCETGAAGGGWFLIELMEFCNMSTYCLSLSKSFFRSS